MKVKNLSRELQKHFSFDPKKAKDAELKQAENKTKNHDQLMCQPAMHAPGMTRTQPTSAPATLALWRSDFPGALKRARAESKLMRLDFTGSDWCPTRIRFDHDVLSSEKFAAYANTKLELVKLDFPRHSPQSPRTGPCQRGPRATIPHRRLSDADPVECGRQRIGPAAWRSWWRTGGLHRGTG